MHAKIITKTKEEIKCRFLSGRESWGIGPSFCHLDSLSKKEKNNTFVVLWAMIINILFRACLHGGGGPQVGEVTRPAVVENKTRLQAILQPRGAGVRFLEVVVALAIKELSRGVPSSHLEKDERLIGIYSWKRQALCYVVLGYASNRWLNTLHGIVWETKYGRFTTLHFPKCEHFTLLVCLVRFLVISAMRRLGNVQSFKTYMFRFRTFCHERDPG